MASPLALPVEPADVTAEFLTVALREGGVIREATVTAVEAEVVGAGVGLLGQLARLTPTYDRPETGAPATVIGKFPAVAPENREVCRQYGIYEREVGFYEQIAEEVALRTPRHYFSRYEPDTGMYLLLLEDLAHARIGDQLAPCSLAEAEGAMRALGEFHAAWWEHPRLASLDWLALADAPVWMAVADTYRASWPGFLQNAGERLTPYMLRVGERLADAIPDLRRRFAQPPLTVCHGDFRLDNIFFDVDGAPHGLAAIDWQLTMRGRGIYDVAYFLTQSVDPEFRRAHQDRLVDVYLEALRAGGVTGYSREEAMDDFRAVAVYFFLSPVAWLSGDLDVSNERGLALATAFLDRSIAAIEDLDAGEIVGAGKETL